MYLKEDVPVPPYWSGKIADIGYDPRPLEGYWHGTPIPLVYNPLPGTPLLVEIAEGTWCRGDPWTILRNRYAFIRNATDHGMGDETELLWELIPRISWVEALRRAKPGGISYISWRFWTWRYKAEDPSLTFYRDPRWLEPLHIRDLVMLGLLRNPARYLHPD